jgi:type VI secretion system protein ImpK
VAAAAGGAGAFVLWRCAADFTTYVQVLASAGGPGFPAAAALRSALLAQLEAFLKSAQEAGTAAEESEAARFALVAWADEVIQRASWAGRDEWQRQPLQAQLYRTTRAGNEFFERLAQLRAEQGAAREIFFLVLALGFEGQYGGQEAERRALVQQQYEALRAAGRLLETARELQLAPSAYQLEIELPAGERELPLGFAAAGGALALALLYGVLWLVLRAVAGEIPLPRGL